MQRYAHLKIFCAAGYHVSVAISRVRFYGMVKIHLPVPFAS